MKRGIFTGRLIHLSNFENTPYFGQERVDYLSKISGFLCIRNIYNFSTLRSKRFLFKSPKIDLRQLNLDFLITTCPLSIEVRTNSRISGTCLQLIMDYIPLSFLNILIILLPFIIAWKMQ